MLTRLIRSRSMGILLIVALVVSVVGWVGAQDSAATPFLGVGLSAADTGVMVEAVQADSPADKAGVQVGDVITAIDGKAVTSETIRDVVGSYKIGDEITLAITRKGESMDIQVTLAERPAATEPPAPTVSERPMIGVRLEDTDNGVVIREVMAGSPAEKAGLKVDDVLTTIGSTDITDAASASAAVQALKVGDEVEVTVERDGQAETVTLTLAASTVPMTTMPMRNRLSVTYNESDQSWTINNVSEDSEFYKAGLRDGDTILRFDGTAYDAAGLRDYLSGVTASEIKLTVSRNGEEQEIEVPMALLSIFDMGAFDFHSGEMPSFTLPFGMNMGGGSRLGVEFLTLNAEVAEQNNVTETSGALVTKISPDSPAEKAGLKANDVVVAVDGDTVDEEHTLRDRLFAYEPGDTVKLDIVRDGEPTQIEVTLDEMPMSDMMPFFGGDNGNFHFEIPMPQQPEAPALNGTAM